MLGGGLGPALLDEAENPDPDHDAEAAMPACAVRARRGYVVALKASSVRRGKVTTAKPAKKQVATS